MVGSEMDAALVGAIAAVLGAILGVIGAFTLEARKADAARADRIDAERREDERRRKSVATCLLQDAQTIEFDFTQYYEFPNPSGFVVRRPNYFWDQLAPEVAKFSPLVVTKVSDLFRRVDHFYQGFDAVQAQKNGRPHSDREAYQIRSHAAFVLQVVPDAVRALTSEGGQILGHSEWKSVTFPTLPAVPSPVFVDTEQQLAQISRRRANTDA